ncbi:MAG: response regulator [Anaerolineae bacterium]
MSNLTGINNHTAIKQSKALVIEDNVDLANVFSIALSEAGFDIEMIHDGSLALSHLAVFTPNIIVLDLHLPHISGEEILNYILGEDRFASTRLIIASADHRLATSLQQDNIIVLIKPVSFKQLRELSTRLKTTF